MWGHMNDPFDIIKRDHETVEKLFSDYETLEEEATEERRPLVDKIIAELELHAEMEETLCYPHFKEALPPENLELIEEAYLEHQEAKTAIEQLKTLDETLPEFEEVVASLIEGVRHHVMEEEQELLPKVKERLLPEVLSAMGDDMITFKESKGGTTP
jgi:hemerythrin-like domain-containing protein